MRAFVGRSAKITAPITMSCGAIADLASTIAKFSSYLCVASICIALISGGMWFLRYRRQFMKAAADGVMQPEEVMQMGERNAWAITFAFAVVSTIVMGGFVLAEKMTNSEEKGVLAATIPGMEELQASLFRVEKKVEAVKEDTTAIKQDTTSIKKDTESTRVETAEIKKDTARIAASVEEMARNFSALAGRGGVIPNASTPEEHYHNARLHELGGNFVAARKEYAEFLQANLDVIDPWLNYAAMIKIQEGRAGALEALRYFGEKFPTKTASYRAALASLEDLPARIAKLEEVAQSNPDFGPVFYLLSQEYAEPKKAEPTLSDQRSEREWLEKFRTARENGKFLKYFLDQKEAQKWNETSEARWSKLAGAANRLQNPVTLIPQQSGTGWGITFGLADYTAKELFYRVDGSGDFKSTGHLAFNSPQTGRPMPNLFVELPGLPPGEHKVEVRYTDRDDRTNGPYTLSFSTADQQFIQGKQMVMSTSASWLSYRDYDGKLLLYFTTLMTARPVIKEVRYSLNNETLDKAFAFKPTSKMFEAGDDTFISIPKNTEYACVQVIYKDGSKSEMKKFPKVTE